MKIVIEVAGDAESKDVKVFMDDVEKVIYKKEYMTMIKDVKVEG